MTDIYQASDNLTFQFVQKGAVQLSSPNSIGSSTNISVVHNLGYKPIVWAFVSFSPTGTRFPLPYLSPHLVGGTPGLIDYQVSFEVVGDDTVTFYHRDISAASNVTDYISYYILREISNPTV